MARNIFNQYRKPLNQSYQKFRKRFSVQNYNNDGFGLIEVVVAALLLLIFSLVMLSSTLTSLTVSVFAKQHSTATSLLTTAVAEAEAEGYPTLSAGLSSTQPSSTTFPAISHWSNLGNGQCTYDYDKTINYTSPCSATGSNSIYFTTSKIANATYTIYMLPEVSGTLITLTVYVTWNSGNGTDQVSGVTQITG